MKSKNVLVTTLILNLFWVITACNDGRVYESFQEMEALKWVVSDTISFNVDSLEASSEFSSILSIRYDDKYEYNNLYVRFLLRDSVDKVLIDSLLNIHLFDPKTGKPLGQGYGNRRLRYDTLPGDVIQPNSTFQFIQYMRKDTLSGIESIGLKINNGQ